MSCIYGPVPSKRLGQSLGVDPIPAKTCNYNCVYCQLGSTRRLISSRRNFYPVQVILDQVESALALAGQGEIDYITIVGQGEPALYASLGDLVRGIKRLTGIPVAIITNGSLLSQHQVREDMSAADVVMPSLDAGRERLFRRINRPWSGLMLSDIIQGMATFRQQFAGRLWIEVMLLRGLNDGEEALLDIREALNRVQPDQVHVNVPTRPPAEAWVEPTDEQGLLRAVAILGDVARLVMPYQGAFSLSPDLPADEAVEQVIRRHPMRESDIIDTLSPDMSPESVRMILRQLETERRAVCVEYRGQRFWRYNRPGRRVGAG